MMQFGSQLFHLCLIVFSCFVLFVSGATLPDNELEALNEIANTLGKKDWNFSVDPCSGSYGWAEASNAVTCNCSYVNSTICHVVSIVLLNQNLDGILPPELVKLPYLQEISLSGNRITGTIPIELGNITTLKKFAVGYNKLSGVLPREFGNMVSIEFILLSSNNFTGRLPETLAKLTTLKDFRINDNEFSGKIPDFIQNWTNLEKIAIQGSGLEGPIPSGISLLTKLADMRISDLKATEAAFPSLSNMKDMKTLILRSCNIIGEIPSYLGDMTNLKTLDLSFNKLTGQIPLSFRSLQTVDFIDLSYNNFALGSSGSSRCQQGNVNLFGSSSLGDNSSSTGVVPCLKSVTCPRKLYSFHINCGGGEVIRNGNRTYEDDKNRAITDKTIKGKIGQNLLYFDRVWREPPNIVQS